MANATCSNASCDEPAHIRGMCDRHYYAWHYQTTKKTRPVAGDRPPCKIDGCDALARYSTGWCRKHHSRWERHGDPLHEPKRLVNDLKKIIDDDPLECVMLAGHEGKRPPPIAYNGGRDRAHRVVLLLTVGPPPAGKPYACHTCGKGHLGCVTPRHLRWDSNSANQMDRVEHGTSNRGRASGHSVLTEEKVRAIRRRLDAGERTGALAKEYGVSPQCISGIKYRRTWAWLE